MNYLVCFYWVLILALSISTMIHGFKKLHYFPFFKAALKIKDYYSSGILELLAGLGLLFDISRLNALGVIVILLLWNQMHANIRQINTSPYWTQYRTWVQIFMIWFFTFLV
ncbi:MAG: hypothetical protein M3Q56_05820 [Bacteroidota bacterium]|nr:hypothetical protein [Bacteroidota bacterium]